MTAYDTQELYRNPHLTRTLQSQMIPIARQSAHRRVSYKLEARLTFHHHPSYIVLQQSDQYRIGHSTT